MSFWQKASQLCVYFLMLIAAWVAIFVVFGQIGVARHRRLLAGADV